MSVSTSTTTASVPHITRELCVSLTRRTQSALDELTQTLRAFTESPSVRTHGALALAVAQCRQLLRLLEAVRTAMQRSQRMVTSATTPTCTSSSEARHHDTIGSLAPSPAALAQLEKQRVELRRVLPRAATVLESGRVTGEGGAAAAADAAASLRSLKQTRSMLALEVKKVESTVQQLSGSAESLGTLHQSLGDIHGAMGRAHAAVGRLLTVQSREDFVLRLSVAMFACVVGFIVLHRVLGFFPTTEYVTVED